MLYSLAVVLIKAHKDTTESLITSCCIKWMAEKQMVSAVKVAIKSLS